MQKISLAYKTVPPIDQLSTLSWYVIFIGTIKNLQGIDHTCKKQSIRDYKIWAPTYQEYYKTQTDLALTDKLIYPGYTFLGLADPENIFKLASELRDESKGFILSESPLSKEDLDHIYENALTFATTPKLMFDVQRGDSVLISSGFLSGFRATVNEITPEGRVVLAVFFMNRELTVDLSVLDIHSLGKSI